MLTEFVPAWVALAGVALVGLINLTPDHLRSDEGRISPRGVLTGVALVGLAAGLVMGPQRVVSFGGAWMTSFRMDLPASGTEDMVFVHGGWEGRMVARLVDAGIPPRTVETVLRQNPGCLVEEHLARVEATGRLAEFGVAERGGAGLPALDVDPRTFEFLPRHDMGGGASFRYDPDRQLSVSCTRQALADRYGAMDASLLLWMGALPGLEEERGRPMIARDLGPELNRMLMDRYPERRPVFFGSLGLEEPLQLHDYDLAMETLWGGVPATPAPTGSRESHIPTQGRTNE